MTIQTVDTTRSLTISEFCQVEHISTSAYYELRQRGDGPEELRFPNSRIVRITPEATGGVAPAYDDACEEPSGESSNRASQCAGGYGRAACGGEPTAP